MFGHFSQKRVNVWSLLPKKGKCLITLAKEMFTGKNNDDIAVYRKNVSFPIDNR